MALHPPVGQVFYGRTLEEALDRRLAWLMVPPPVPAGQCDPSYPGVCIPPYPPDLDCGEIGARRFTVHPPDPLGFDGNGNDGRGCES